MASATETATATDPDGVAKDGGEIEDHGDEDLVEVEGGGGS